MKNLTCSLQETILEVMKKLDQTGMEIVIALDEDNHLIGIVTDGDVRRGLIRGFSLEDSIEKILNRNPKVFSLGTSTSEIQKKLRENHIEQAPIIDSEGRFVSLEFAQGNRMSLENEYAAVIMAGGMGTRLYPLTREIPKPMMKIMDKPVLEHIINKLEKFGYRKIYISICYLGEIIENYFQDGKRFGVDIEYLREDKQMGTAGSLSLIQDRKHSHYLIMNGDVLSDVDLDFMLNCHLQDQNQITIASRREEIGIAYGVLEIQEDKVAWIEEKPTFSLPVNCGIYFVSEKILSYIQNETFLQMTTLINQCIQKNLQVGFFPMGNFWVDIGKPEDLLAVQKRMDFLGEK